MRRYHLEYDAGSHVSLLDKRSGRGTLRESERTRRRRRSDDSRIARRRMPAPAGDEVRLRRASSRSRASGAAGTASLAGYEGFDERLMHTGRRAAEHSVDDELTDLFDINSDALARRARHRAAAVRQRATACSSTAAAASLTCVRRCAADVGIDGGARRRREHNHARAICNVAPLDLDGDATIDLLHMPKVKTYAVYTPRRGRSGWAWQGRASRRPRSGQSPKIDLRQGRTRNTRSSTSTSTGSSTSS